MLQITCSDSYAIPPQVSQCLIITVPGSSCLPRHSTATFNSSVPVETAALAVAAAVGPDDRPAAAALLEAAVDVHGADAARGTLPAALKREHALAYSLAKGLFPVHAT